MKVVLSSRIGRKTPPRFSSRNGFTLIETLIACVILLLVLAGSYLVLDASMDLIRSVRDAYAATTISNARLERARTVPLGDLFGLAEVGTIVDDYGLPTTEGRFRRVTMIYTNQPTVGCATVLVTTDVRQPGKPVGTFYNSRTLRAICTTYDMP